MKNDPKTRYTPGPWFQCCEPLNDQVCSKPVYDQARALGLDDETACGESLIVETAENTANARLIAAAPEYYEFLKWIETQLDDSKGQARIYSDTLGPDSYDETVLQCVRRLIAKCNGGAQ